VIEAAIDRILGLAPPVITQIGNRSYSNQALHLIKEPEPAPLTIHTLTGVVNYVKGLSSDHAEGAFLQVLSHQEVRLLSTLCLETAQRACFLVAKPPESRGYPFGNWLDLETFIIELQAKFVSDDTSRDLLQMISSIKDEFVKTSTDDGFSQTVTAKAGIALVDTVKVPNPVTLRPYRTFMEVDQPPSTFVLRLRKGIEISLHEADGGQWRLKAIQAIREYLETAMGDSNPKIPVIA